MFPHDMGESWHARGGRCGEGFFRGHFGLHAHHGHGSGMHGPPGGGGFGMHGHHGDGGGGFGVRRPLRFLAYRLELDERQTAELARILDDLRTEHAQAAVDERRAISAIADALAGDALDEAKLAEAGDARVASAQRLRGAVVTALGKLHALLDAEQRKQLAFLVRTGAVQF